MIALIAIVGFICGVPFGFMTAVLAKKMFLSLPPAVFTSEQLVSMYQENIRIAKLNLAAKTELDKLSACSTRL